MLVEKDKLITKAIEEKQNLVAQILNVPLHDFHHVAEVRHCSSETNTVCA